jgi:hypothetical protein
VHLKYAAARTTLRGWSMAFLEKLTVTQLFITKHKRTQWRTKEISTLKSVATSLTTGQAHWPIERTVLVTDAQGSLDRKHLTIQISKTLIEGRIEIKLILMKR